MYVRVRLLTNERKVVAGFGPGPWRPIDLTGKIVFNATAVLLLIGLIGRVACSDFIASPSTRGTAPSGTHETLLQQPSSEIPGGTSLRSYSVTAEI
jgi:hypothetical protein